MDCTNCKTYFHGTKNHKCPNCGEMHESYKYQFIREHPNAKKTQCEICESFLYYPGEGIRHHTCYLPITTIIVCFSCHKKVHRGGIKQYCPSRRMSLIFHSKKGSLYTWPKEFRYWTGKNWCWSWSRPLTEWEQTLRKAMKKEERIAINNANNS